MMTLIGDIGTSAIVGGVVGGVAGGLAVVLMAAFAKPRNCPSCQTQLPKYRKARNTRQALWGGWTCGECGCEIDRKGNKID